MLEARGLTKRFGAATAVAALDLAVNAGEVYALLGPNGAGKTTTINLFLGFLAPDAGAALVDGLDVQAEPLETKRRLAYLPEQVALYPSLSGAENLGYFAALAGHELSDAQRAGFLDQAGLQREAHARRAGTYSKGMRQKVGVALALAKGAKALLLDEPTSGLDPSASAEFSGLVRRLAEDGAAVLMATHDLFRVKDTARRVGVLVDGRLREEVAGEALRTADLEALYLGHVREALAPA
ncbi:MAG: ABC transporter ATP-binding protein [Bacteroidota bacterium]